jgi:hypothetical protein
MYTLVDPCNTVLGAPPEQVSRCLDALRSNAHPDMALLKPLVRAKVLAHLASRHQARSEQLGELPDLQDSLKGSAAELVKAAHEKSRMPVSDDMLDKALVDLRSKHVEAMVEGLSAAADGAGLLTQMITSASGDLSSRLLFVKAAAASWERANASELERLSEKATGLEAGLRSRPEPQAAAKLGQIIRGWASLTDPALAAAAAFKLQHQSWNQAFWNWRVLASVIDSSPTARKTAFSRRLTLSASVSYTDAVVMAVADEYQTEKTFGFDEAFANCGYENTPRWSEAEAA